MPESVIRNLDLYPSSPCPECKKYSPVWSKLDACACGLCKADVNISEIVDKIRNKVKAMKEIGLEKPSEIFAARPKYHYSPSDFEQIAHQMGYSSEMAMWGVMHTQDGMSAYRITLIIRQKICINISEITVRNRLTKLGIYDKHNPKGKKLPRRNGK
jgi:hypothetical protein